MDCQVTVSGAYIKTVRIIFGWVLMSDLINMTAIRLRSTDIQTICQVRSAAISEHVYMKIVIIIYGLVLMMV